jgi:DNA-binding NarL/FixJ family response regulator
MADPSPIRLLLVDDHPLFRKGIASLLAAVLGEKR